MAMEVVAVCKVMRMIRSTTLYCIKFSCYCVRNSLVFFGGFPCILPVSGWQKYVALVYTIMKRAKRVSRYQVGDTPLLDCILIDTKQ